MTGIQISFVLLLSLLLGLLVLVVRLPWLLLFPLLRPPLLILYPIWITGCAMYAWASYTRKSFGMLANYLLLVTIDVIGLVRML